MGIEDLDLDLETYADRVLVIASDEELRNQLTSLLEKRSYQYCCVESVDLSVAFAGMEVFDLIICCHSAEYDSPNDQLSQIQSESLLRSIPVILLTSMTEDVDKIVYRF